MPGVGAGDILHWVRKKDEFAKGIPQGLKPHRFGCGRIDLAAVMYGLKPVPFSQPVLFCMRSQQAVKHRP
ncbi:MAG: hypothetical protein ACRD25_10635 [Terracidiphilus sp.]